MPSQEFLNRRGSIWERTDFAGRPFPELRREMDARVMEELKIPEGVETPANPVTDDTVVSANVLSPEEILAGMDAMGEKYRAQGGKLYSKASE